MSNLIFVSFILTLAEAKYQNDLEPFLDLFLHLVPKGLHTRLLNTITGYAGYQAHIVYICTLLHTIAHAYAPMYNMR